MIEFFVVKRKARQVLAVDLLLGKCTKRICSANGFCRQFKLKPASLSDLTNFMWRFGMYLTEIV